jgi:hypothetical protein
MLLCAEIQILVVTVHLKNIQTKKIFGVDLQTACYSITMENRILIIHAHKTEKRGRL